MDFEADRPLLVETFDTSPETNSKTLKIATV